MHLCHQVFCDMPPTQAGIIPVRGSQYQNNSDTDFTLAVKDTKSDFHMALHWLLISVPTANLAHAETIKLTNKTKAKVVSQINGVKNHNTNVAKLKKGRLVSEPVDGS